MAMSILSQSESLTRLVEKCRKGDQQAWSELVDRFQRLVYSTARRYGLADDDCADVFQSTFTALYQSLDRITNPETLPKWLAVTAAREGLRLRRMTSITTLDDMALDEVIASEEATAESDAIAALGQEALWNAVDRLPQRCRELLRSLYGPREISYEEISENLGIPMGSIGPTRARCLERLRKALSQDDFFEAYVSPARPNRS